MLNWVQHFQFLAVIMRTLMKLMVDSLRFCISGMHYSFLCEFLRFQTIRYCLHIYRDFWSVTFFPCFSYYTYFKCVIRFDAHVLTDQHFDSRKFSFKTFKTINKTNNLSISPDQRQMPLWDWPFRIMCFSHSLTIVTFRCRQHSYWRRQPFVSFFNPSIYKVIQLTSIIHLYEKITKHLKFNQYRFLNIYQLLWCKIYDETSKSFHVHENCCTCYCYYNRCCLYVNG